MSLRDIEILELIQVEEHQCPLSTIPRAVDQVLVEPVRHQFPIGLVGDGIIVSQMVNPLHGLFLPGGAPRR